jgi:galactofuranosylgalactofuranosylrhamnosyl-N-acetylglucosaminyl-diphospho-decaprenol beta-1,5/1,6-galactofuranosyltransferase
MDRTNNFWTLQPAVFPATQIGVSEKLYWRRRSHCSCDAAHNEFRLLSRGSINFESYFNSFSLRDWAHFCGLDNICLRVAGQGEILLEVHRASIAGTCLVFSQLMRLDPQEPALLDFSVASESGAAGLQEGYLFTTCYSERGATMSEISYGTTLPPRRKVKLGGVITHFRRESLVLPAIRRFKEELAADEQLRRKFSLAVVDNSMSLPPTEDQEGIEIIPNGNYGGAGGFSRGLLHFAERGDFTHVVFMDDDATLELASIKRTISYLAYELDPRAAVAGTLFIHPATTVVYEAGARMSAGVHHPCGRGADVTTRDGLLRLQGGDDKPSYGGWWFFAFPLSKVTHYPFPYFVRGDDAAFGAANSFEVRVPGGVACWGDSFSAKETPLNRYLDARHALRHVALFEPKHMDAALATFCRWVKDLADSYRYAAAEATLLGMQDALQSTSFWEENIDLASIRTRLAPLVAEDKFSPTAMFDDDTMSWLIRKKWDATNLSARVRGPVRGSWLRFSVRKLTLNSHLLPAFFSPRGPVVLAKNAPPRLVYPYRSAIFLDDSGRLALVCRANLLRYLQLRFRLIKYHCFFKKRRASLFVDISNSFTKLATQTFWQRLYTGTKD